MRRSELDPSRPRSLLQVLPSFYNDPEIESFFSVNTCIAAPEDPVVLLTGSTHSVRFGVRGRSIHYQRAGDSAVRQCSVEALPDATPLHSVSTFTCGRDRHQTVTIALRGAEAPFCSTVAKLNLQRQSRRFIALKNGLTEVPDSGRSQMPRVGR
jgi:hypothetical protein